MMDAGEGRTDTKMTEIAKADPATGDNPSYIADSLNRERQHSTTEPGKDASAEILEIKVV